MFSVLRLSSNSMVPALLKELVINQLIKKFKSKTTCFKLTVQMR